MAGKLLRSPLSFHRPVLSLWLVFICLMLACGRQEQRSGEISKARPEAPANGQRSSAAIDPCVLVTGAEAEPVLGAPVREAERPPEANHQYLATCRYVAPRGESVVVLSVMVHSREVGRRAFQTAKDQPFEIQPVADLGDDAFWIATPLNTLYVLKDDVSFTIGGDVQLEQVRSLAQNALERLQ